MYDNEIWILGREKHVKKRLRDTFQPFIADDQLTDVLLLQHKYVKEHLYNKLLIFRFH